MTKSLICGNPNSTSKKNIYGLQAGIENKINKNFDIFVQYQYLKVKHTLKIIEGASSSEIVRENQSNAMVGIRWNFK